jgi:hypothetical protein
LSSRDSQYSRSLRRVANADGQQDYYTDDRRDPHLEKHGYRHRISFAKGSAADPLPRVHRVVSLLKRWLQGTIKVP